MDRISELPEPILQHILCFLSQNEAVQTCVLSKSWRHLWSTRPIVEFRENLFRGNKEAFMSIIDQTLQRYHHQNLSVKQFTVGIWSFDPNFVSLLVKWVPIVLLNMRAETFHLMFDDRYYIYVLPSAPVPLKELYLENCHVRSPGPDKLGLYHLQKLSLVKVFIVGNTLEEIMTCCPLIRRVELDRPDGLSYDCLFSSNNHHFPRLKSLNLTKVQLSPEAIIDNFLCNSQCLEDLELIRCHDFNHVKILSPSLKRLIIVNTYKQIKTISIDAPSMLFFEFKCRFSLPSISFASLPSKDLIFNISVPIKLQSSGWFLKINQLLKGLSQSRITLNLFYDAKWNRHIKEISYSCPVAVEHLSLRGFVPSHEFAPLFNCLLRIFRPSYISMTMYPSPRRRQRLEINKLAEFICKTNLEDREFSRFHFWRQELKEFSIEILDRDSRQWCLVQGSSFPVCESTNTLIRFGFEWRDYLLCYKNAI